MIYNIGEILVYRGIQDRNWQGYGFKIEVHPYEEIGLEIIPLFDEDSFK